MVEENNIILKDNGLHSDEDEPLIDKTEPLVLHSRRTERLQRKQQKRAKTTSHGIHGLLNLPYELFVDILSLVEPSDIFCLARVSKSLHSFIFHEERILANSIIQWRYPCLQNCFRLPETLDNMNPQLYPALLSKERQQSLTIHRKPYQHIKAPEPTIICSCLTCMLRWNSLSLIVDFAHWQDNLDNGEPIPMIPRGTFPEWNQDLIDRNATIVRKAIDHPLWYARILQVHLESTVRSINRHSANEGNKRPRFRLNQADIDSRTDEFLDHFGPATLDVPFHRDNYYMLEAYLPNRGWDGELRQWNYLPADQHDKDLEFVVRFAQRRGILPSAA